MTLEEAPVEVPREGAIPGKILESCLAGVLAEGPMSETPFMFS